MQETKDKKTRYLAAKRRLFDRVFGERLNPPQRAAVFTAKGPLLVLAGAGSGKTTVLVHRVGYLIKYGNAYFDDSVPEDLSDGMLAALEAAVSEPPEVIREILPQFIKDPCPPWAVMAITFTNKAAREIRERLEESFSDPAVTEEITAGTFHSVSVRILRRYGERLGYRPGFSIYDTDDKKRLLTMCMKDLGIDEKVLSVKAVANAVSMAKDRLETPEELSLGQDPREREIRRIYSYYQKKLMEFNAVDFDDIIMQTVRLLEEDAEVRSYYQNRYRYVLVDEYQDTNYAQFVLTKLLSDKYRNLMVVGDDDQSIYRFRGATVENILNFDKTYPDAKVVKLEQNYRSTECILDAANAVISHNGDRHEKKLWCEKGRGEKIVLKEAEDQIGEGRYIVDRIVRAVAGGRHYSDFAVLYRVNEMARSLEGAFTKSGIPYRILGGQRFYDKKEIRDMLAYLSLTDSTDDDLRLKRIINEPKRKIGAATVDAVESIARMNGMSMYTVMSRADEYVALGKSAEKLKSFVALIDGLRAREMKPSERIEAIFEESGYHAMLTAEGFEGEGRIDSVKEFVSAAAEYEARCEENSVEPTLSGFLEEVSLVSDVDKYDETADAVVLMTVHSAKGLEFPVVFLAGMEDGVFPGAQNLGEPQEMSEERRLAYVAITRAKEMLYITHAKCRMMYGKTAFNPLSVFVREEIPKELIFEETPKAPPPRSDFSPFGRTPRETPHLSDEMRRRPDMAPRQRGAGNFGVEKFAPGTRVLHPLLGEGVILSAKDMGGDILYAVRFADGTEKKLMATFAKMKRL